MATEIFLNKTTDDIVNAKTANGGIIQVDISGVLDGADVITTYLNDAGIETIVDACSWMPSIGDILTNSDGATKYIQNRNFRFKIVNAGALTNISFFASHDSGSLKKI